MQLCETTPDRLLPRPTVRAWEGRHSVTLGPIDLEGEPSLVLCFDPGLDEASALLGADRATVVCDAPVDLQGAEGAPRARWDELEQACEVAKKLETAPPPALAGAGIFPYYNSRRYDNRGWCVFEQGAASVVLAHFEEVERQGRTLPARLAAAQAARPKVIDVSDGTPRKLELGGVAPDLLLDKVTDRLRDEDGDVRFTGTGDRAMVCELLTKFEWTIHTSMSMGVNLTESARRVLARPATGCWPILRYASLKYNRVELEAVREVQLGAETNA